MPSNRTSFNDLKPEQQLEIVEARLEVNGITFEQSVRNNNATNVPEINNDVIQTLQFNLSGKKYRNRIHAVVRAVNKKHQRTSQYFTDLELFSVDPEHNS